MEDRNVLRKLPKGLQSFEKIRREGRVYVDKTDLMWKLVNGDTYNFLGRPRRLARAFFLARCNAISRGIRIFSKGLG